MIIETYRFPDNADHQQTTLSFNNARRVADRELALAPMCHAAPQDPSESPVWSALLWRKSAIAGGQYDRRRCGRLVAVDEAAVVADYEADVLVNAICASHQIPLNRLYRILDGVRPGTWCWETRTPPSHRGCGDRCTRH